MANSPFPGGPREVVDRDEPNRRSGAPHGNQGDDRQQGDLTGPGNFADRKGQAADNPGARKEGLVRGAPPKPRKRYSLAD